MKYDSIAVRDMQRPKFNREKYSCVFNQTADAQRAKGRDSFEKWYQKLDRFHQSILKAQKRG